MRGYDGRDSLADDFLRWLTKAPQPTSASDRIARQRWLQKVAPL
jgi:hypothetical protein